MEKLQLSEKKAALIKPKAFKRDLKKWIWGGGDLRVKCVISGSSRERPGRKEGGKEGRKGGGKERDRKGEMGAGY